MSFRNPRQDVGVLATSLDECVFGGNDAADLDRVTPVDVASTETTYGETRSRMQAFAGALSVRGIGVGDVVAIPSPNNQECAIVLQGFLRACATAATVHACAPSRKSPSRSMIRSPRCSLSSRRCWSGRSPILLLRHERQHNYRWRALGATALRPVSGAAATQ
jgi:hypothetical protein